MSASGRPALGRHVRLTLDPTRDQEVLLGPESVAVLNATSADILRLCDGGHTVGEIVEELRRRYDRVAEGEVRAFLSRMAARNCVEILDGP